MSAASPSDNPEFLPFKLDLVTRRVLWLRLSAAQRAEAAFLDERALPERAEGGWLPLSSLPDAPPAAPLDAIFHIGHCGSTLLSRLLQSWPELQALREPLPLRTLADAWPARGRPESRLAPEQGPRLLRALSSAWRPLPPQCRSVIKATSSCNGLIAPLLAVRPALRVLLLDMPLQPYLATVMKSPGATLDAASAAGERLCALRARLGDAAGDDLALHALSPPEQCAMGWLAERQRFDALARGECGTRVLRIDFERLLAAPEAVLPQIAAHLQLPDDGVQRALRAPEWNRYAKAQAHRYGRDDRAHDLALAAERFGDEIAAGRTWVERFLRRHPALAAAAEG